MALLTSGTVMELSGISLPNYSARKLRFTSQPIDPGELAWDANGALHDLTMVQFRKYAFTVTCTDFNPPDLTDVWKGKVVSLTVVPGTGIPQDSDETEQTFTCMVSDWSTDVDEWDGRTGWTLSLLQV